MAQIRSDATSLETLKNGAVLFHLKGGREVEQATGKTPYVVAAGNWPKQPAPAATSATPTTPATTK